MPLRCVERPNRSKPRTFTARSVGKIYCHAVRNGVPVVEIEQEIRKCKELEERKTDDEQQAAIEAAIAALESSNIVFGNEETTLLRMLQLLNIVAGLGRFLVRIPAAPARAVGAGAIVLKELAESRLKIIVAQKAANDATLSVLRRAAANAPSFRRVVGGN